MANRFRRVLRSVIYAHFLIGVAYLAAMHFIIGDDSRPLVTANDGIAKVLVIYALHYPVAPLLILVSLDLIVIYAIRTQSVNRRRRAAWVYLASSATVASAHWGLVAMGLFWGTVQTQSAIHVFTPSQIVWPILINHFLALAPPSVVLLIHCAKRRSPHVCIECGYDLRGLTSDKECHCPECGMRSPPSL